MPSIQFAAALAVTFASAFCGSASAEVLIYVDKDAQRMTITVDRARLFTWPVSTGLPGQTETPNGTFRANRMDADHHSQEYNRAPMPYTVFFDLHGHAVHGILDASHIGNPGSHGCVRLPTDKAALLFDLIKTEGLKATTVVVTGRTPSPQSLFLARRRAFREANTTSSLLFITHVSDKLSPHNITIAAEIDRLQEATVLQPPLADYDLLLPPAPDDENAVPSS